MRRRYIGRRRQGQLAKGSSFPSFRPQGRISRRTVRIGRMSQFPTVVRVKFVQEATTNFDLPAVPTPSWQWAFLNLIPVNTFTLSGAGMRTWLDVGKTATIQPYPLGWQTWLYAYGRYKTLATRVEFYPQVMTGDYGKGCVLITKLMPVNALSTSPTLGTPETWLVDPQAKQINLEPAGNGTVQLNQPALVLYSKPFDVYKRNQDWSVIEATMTTIPTRYIQCGVALLRTQPANGGNVTWGIRCRVTHYVELFDRKSDVDAAYTAIEEPAALKAALVGRGEIDINQVPEFVVDRKVAI